MSTINNFERFLDEVWGLYLDSKKYNPLPFAKKVSIYNIANSCVSMHVHIYEGTIKTEFTKYTTISYYKSGLPRHCKTQNISVEEALDILPYDATSLLVLNSFIFGV